MASVARTVELDRLAAPRGSAYGLAVRGGVEIPGLGPAAEDAVRGHVVVSLDDAPPARVNEAAEVLFSQPDGRRQEVARLERSAAGYRLRIAGLAEFGISSDGHELHCWPEAEAAWRWQRVLAGQALPMCALLQGIEVLHAGAVAFDGAAGRTGIAIAGSSHGGKSSLTVGLVLRGARLITDDALAVELAPDGAALAHPGIGAATLRRSELDRLCASGDYDRLQLAGEADDSARVLVEPEPAPVQLAAIYWPRRDASLDRLEIASVPPDPRRLLAGTINLVLRDPDRLRRHFEISTAIAARVPLYAVGVPRGVDAAVLAEAIDRHMRGRRM